MRDDAFHAVADGRRRQILELLKTGERSAGEIAARFDVSWPAISRHLRVLKRAGLVRQRRAGRERHYSLERARIREIFGSWVAGFDRLGQEDLEALEHHVETRARGGANDPPGE